MKKNTWSLWGAISVLTFASCGQSGVRNTYADKFESLCEVTVKGTKSYVLDDNTALSMIEYVRYIPDDSIPLFSFLNPHTNAIYLYDAKQDTLRDVVRFDLEGSNGVGNLQGYCYHNADSIFTYATSSGQVKLADQKGTVARTYRMFDPDAQLEDTTRFLTSPYLESRMPMLYAQDGTLLMGGGFLAETTLERADNTFVTLLYDIRTENCSYANPYPEQYRHYDWGGNFFYRQPSMDLAGAGKVILSFPADHHVWIYDLSTGQRDSVYAGSRLIKTIKPFNESKQKFPDDVPEEAISDWYYSQPSYDAVLADPYRQLYYRIARLPFPNHRKGTLNDKPVVVIVLDKDFHYLGESRLPEGKPYNPYNAYVSPEGLHIQLADLKDEDHLTFQILGVERKHTENQ